MVLFYILRQPQFSLGNAKVYIYWNKLTMMFHLRVICSLKTLRYYTYLFNYLLNINTKFVKWLILNCTFSGWKGWDSFNLLLMCGHYLPSHPWKWSHQLCLHLPLSDSLFVKVSCPMVGCVSLLESSFFGCWKLHSAIVLPSLCL